MKKTSNILKAAIVLVLVAGFGLGQKSQAQQISHYTQTLLNPYIYNPAVAGTNNYFQMRIANRLQWIGINDAPVTFNVSCYGPFAKRDMGWGAYITSDNTGPTSKLSVMGSYAYNMQLTKDLRISGGIALGMMQYRLDLGSNPAGELDYDPDDPAIPSSAKSNFLPDASIGFYLWNASFNVGFAIHQLFAERVKFYPEMIGKNRKTRSVLKHHYMLSAGYWMPLNKRLDLELSLVTRYMIGAPIELEANAKLAYRQTTYEVWGGLSVRYRDAVSVLLGATIKKKYVIGYSFDWSVMGISRYNAGSHEIMIGYLFDKLK